MDDYLNNDIDGFDYEEMYNILKVNNSHFFRTIAKDKIKCMHCESISEVDKSFELIGFKITCKNCKMNGQVFTKRKTFKNNGFYFFNNIGYWFESTFKDEFNCQIYEVYKKIDGVYYRKNISINYYNLSFSAHAGNYNYEPNSWIKCTNNFNKFVQWNFEELNINDHTKRPNDTVRQYDEFVKMSPYLNYKKLLQISEWPMSFEKCDMTILEHHQKRLDQYYTRLYVDDGYNCLEFNKSEIKFLLKNKLTILQLNALKETKIQNINRLDGYIRREKEKPINERLNKIASQIKHLNAIVDNYHFIVPKSNRELVHDGNVLNHCVKGYGQKINENCKVIFMRTEVDQPLYTIEINNDTIVQFKAHSNKKPPKTAIKALKNYVESKNLKWEGRF